MFLHEISGISWLTLWRCWLHSCQMFNCTGCYLIWQVLKTTPPTPLLPLERERKKNACGMLCVCVSLCLLNWEGSMVVSSKALLLSSSKDSHVHLTSYSADCLNHFHHLTAVTLCQKMSRVITGWLYWQLLVLSSSTISITVNCRVHQCLVAFLCVQKDVHKLHKFRLLSCYYYTSVTVTVSVWNILTMLAK